MPAYGLQVSVQLVAARALYRMQASELFDCKSAMKPKIKNGVGHAKYLFQLRVTTDAVKRITLFVKS